MRQESSEGNFARRNQYAVTKYRKKNIKKSQSTNIFDGTARPEV